MLSLLNDNLNNGLLFIYGLIGVVIILIIIITIIDKIDNKKNKNKKSLADTLSMKPIKDDDFENTNVEILSVITKDKNNKPIDLLEISKYEEPKKEERIEIPEPKKAEIRIEEPIIEEIKEEPIPEEVEEILDAEEIETYMDDELEKTQAQIRVEEITKALEAAQVDEKIEQDKYAKFEQEQEQNAFISYEELKNNYDRLYEENEKTQYQDDNTIPINIKELYDAANMEKSNDIETLDFDDKPVDNEINNANSFLNNLKELRDNLD